ncbi:thioesterase domain-containing protein [Chitinivorax tropicus]|uniref:Thioesterase domain-containing protein n=1 Tax=Chitinivorax tropicus TaxID=714531 RepID=A0A840MTS1_9PROT|nr:YiiD C-terminal domain-containing protein [Chitinivorax tropicus]MBB5019766.1 thioesterase domain-containing protein [Chitinivorax tropicus]
MPLDQQKPLSERLLTLTAQLREQIPLAEAIDLYVTDAGDAQLTIAAPLAVNRNPHGTVFAGSAVSVAILAAWSLLDGRLRSMEGEAQLVLQRNTMAYLRPIDGPFAATARLQDESAWLRFQSMLQRKGRARIVMTSVIMCGEAEAAVFEGEFVALRAMA